MNPAPNPLEPLLSTPLPDVNHAAEFRQMRDLCLKAAAAKAVKHVGLRYEVHEHRSFHGAGLTATRFEVVTRDIDEEPELVGHLIVPTAMLRGGA